MARGRSLDESDLRVVKTDYEEGNVPYFIIDNDYAISCDKLNEMLVTKKIAKRTNSDNPSDPFIEQYIKWEAIGYYRTFSDALIGYLTIAEKEKKAVLPEKYKDIKEVVKIQKELYDNLSKSLDIEGLNHDYINKLKIFDERQILEKDLKELRELKNKVETETQKLLDLIDEKRKIIIKK